MTGGPAGIDDALSLSTILRVAVSIEASRVGVFDVAIVGVTRASHKNDFGRAGVQSRNSNWTAGALRPRAKDQPASHRLSDLDLRQHSHAGLNKGEASNWCAARCSSIARARSVTYG